MEKQEIDLGNNSLVLAAVYNGVHRFLDEYRSNAIKIRIHVYSVLPKQRAGLIANRDLRVSTFLHTVRIPAEIYLFLLFTHNLVPELMTYEGRNFDILAGITAPIIGLLFIKNWFGMWSV